ncbi:exodeoxyribonuclease VII large subunit [Flavobacterium sp. P21]|uniref:exodeoxyribonuclease VII large subunit n=1 Tax=Flavobacterium sp. P21 TaxID=3423948 RepID=UPI003D674412
MEPENFITLSQLNYQIHQTISERFKGRTYWVVADVTSHTYKADKKIHYFELVEKGEKNSAITAKIMGKAWGKVRLGLRIFKRRQGRFLRTIFMCWYR